MAKSKQAGIFAVLIVAGHQLFAQAKLNISGAKVNLGTGIFLSTNDITVTGTTLNVSNATLKVANSINSANAIDISNGTLEMNGVSNQQIPANSITNNLAKNVTVSGNGIVTVAGPLSLTDVLTISGGATLESAGNLTLKSFPTKTARVAPVTSTSPTPATGDVIVERYITAKRAFRFLTAPINSSTNIRANWMENTNNTTSVNINPVPGYGTHISGVGGGTNGFDFTNTNNPSLFKFNFANQSFIPVTSTNGTFSAGQPFRILIRGDRSINLGLNAPEPTPTTLRAKGVLATGTFKLTKAGGGGSPNMPELSTIDSAFNFVANPYASPIDWDLLDRTNITSTLTIFDGSINFRGAYVNYNALTGTNGISNVDNHIQSGQAFMVQTAGPNPSLTFKESYKTTEHRAVFRTGATLPRIVVQLLMPQQGSQATAVDAFAAYFSNDFDSSIGDEDSRKLSNQDENIAILRNGKLLSIEGRKPVSGKDTLPVRLWQLTRKDYSFRVAITNFEENVNSYVFDNYLQTLEKCKNNDVTVLPFSINNDTASFATNRFKIVFQNFSTLPVTLAGVKAYPKNKGVQVEWTTQSESNMAKYEVETSSNAQQFTTKGTVPAQANATGSAYSWFDASPFNGDNYYRIKAISKSGEITYSEVVKVNISNNEKKGSVQFVSASANTINFKLNNIEKGRYAVSLLNSGGQKVYSASLTTSAGSANEVINLKNLLSAGIYHLQLSSPQNTYNVPVIIP